MNNRMRGGTLHWDEKRGRVCRKKHKEFEMHAKGIAKVKDEGLAHAYPIAVCNNLII